MGKRNDIRNGVLNGKSTGMAILRLLILIAALAVFMLLLGCSETLVHKYCEGDQTLVTLNLNCSIKDEETKSVLADETGINDINVYILDPEGFCSCHKYCVPGKLTAKLWSKVRYDIYVIANAGYDTGIADLDDITAMRIEAESPEIASGRSGLLMSGFIQRLLPSEMTSVLIPMERCFCKINLKIDTSRLSVSKIKLDSAVLCNIPSSVMPFSESKSADIGDVFDKGFTVSGISLQSIDKKGINLYCYENAQGVLLEGNPDEKEKVFDESDTIGKLCTYLELYCTCERADGHCKIRYRMYLGNNTCTDFSLLRNREYSVSVALSESGTDEITWRVIVYGFQPVLPEPGCFFYSDTTFSSSYDEGKTCIGILYDVDTTRPAGNRYWIVGLEESGILAWSTLKDHINGLAEVGLSLELDSSSMDGKQNTYLIAETADYSENNYPAAYYCLGYTTPGFGPGNWILGSYKQLLPLYDSINRDLLLKVNSAIFIAGGTELESDVSYCMWSSTPMSESFIWCFTRYNTTAMILKSWTINVNKVRPILQI
ncbi:MAG: DUF4906 domain-containing protein [Bacteroidales bacterium]|jgi:hypothetical protein|nr:DUF4906 domain-containing protein [Bacteroidales bacterium]MCI2121777.1 DUF4906 domain-containing protein [Bacteroidales bacterium]MCI2144763.1 DUF4906 domain-containing protein [Bacteroidales bacterium]